MTEQTNNYIVLKPIAERFNVVAEEITDEDIKHIITSVMKEKIAEAINFYELTLLIDDYIDEHKDEIAHATMDSIAQRLELPNGYKFY